jgi:hypothetical protein
MKVLTVDMKASIKGCESAERCCRSASLYLLPVTYQQGASIQYFHTFHTSTYDYTKLQVH